MGDPYGGMWLAIRERLAGEDLRASFADALDVVRAIDAEPPGSTGWEAWEGHRLKALYLVVISFTGGADGTAPLPANLHQPPLRALRAELSQRLRELAGPGDALSEDDLAAIQALGGLDTDCMEAARLIASGQYADDVVTRLQATADGYSQVLANPRLTRPGRKLIAWKTANALDWLASSHSQHRQLDAAWTCWAQAAAVYAEAGDPVHEQRSRDKMAETDQRRAPDADTLLGSLITQLDASTPDTLARAGLLVRLAELSIAQSDVFGAKEWTAKAVGELSGLHYPVPASDDVGAAVTGWCSAIPAGPPGENRFFATFGTLNQVQAVLATVRQVTEPERAAVHEAVIEGLADVVAGIPTQMEAVSAALDARLGDFVVPGWSPESAQSLAASARAAATLAAHREVMRGIGRLEDGLAEIVSGVSDAEAAVAMAERVVDRALTLTDPVTAAQAFSCQGQVLLAAGRLADAVAPLQRAYHLVSELEGATERDVAILALSILTSVYAGLGDWATLSAVAGDAIAAVERDRYRINAPYLRASYLSRYLEVFVAGIFSAFKLDDFDTMLSRIELAKGHAGLRALVPTAGEGPGPDDLGDLIRAASSDIEAARRAGSPHVSGLIDKRQRLWDLRAVKHRGGDIPQFSMSALQAELAADEGIVDYYWLSDTVLLVVTITTTGHHVERKILTGDQRHRLDGFIAEIASLKGANLSLDATFLAPLAPVLLPSTGFPLLDGVRRLAISPHRTLHWFPFHALPLGPDKVARRFAVRYVPNLTSVLMSRPAVALPLFLGVGVTHFPDEPDLEDLTGVDEEIDRIASAYRVQGFDSVVLTPATRKGLGDLSADGTLGRAGCLQLSTHGSLLSQTAPMEASIYLADGRIDGLEIGLWDLNCEVVVLGSCDSGQLAVTDRDGGELASDEMFGLPAALLAAGARSVLASSWPVDNDTAMAFIPQWHQYMLDGHPADVALQLAQVAFLDKASFKQKRAYYWAPFFLLSIGRPEALPRPRRLEADATSDQQSGAAHG